jgi:hypothetical protein
MNAWLAGLPTTNLRILASIALLVATGVVTMVRWTDPPSGWLVMLGVALGLDVTQFHLKRKTTFPPAPAKETGA